MVRQESLEIHTSQAHQNILRQAAASSFQAQDSTNVSGGEPDPVHPDLYYVITCRALRFRACPRGTSRTCATARCHFAGGHSSLRGGHSLIDRQGPIVEHVYYCLLKLYEQQQDPGLRVRVLQCLGKISCSTNGIDDNVWYTGFLFRAQPVLMTHHTSADVMDAIFASPDEDSRSRLLMIMQDFLTSQASKNTSKERGMLGQSAPRCISPSDALRRTRSS